jgi:hypothetical protein
MPHAVKADLQKLLRGLSLLRYCLILWFICSNPGSFADSLWAATQIPGGSVLYLRLLTPVSSYSSKEGDPVRAVLIEPVDSEEFCVIPADSIATGRIGRVNKVGLGIHHEKALLELVFDSLIVPSGQRLKMETQLITVENAREEVKNGIIQGILSTETPQGRITSRLIHLPTFNPYTDTTLLVFKTLFPVFPEPEINLPVGCDLQLKLLQPIDLPQELPIIPFLPEISEPYRAQLDQLVQGLPVRVMDKDGKTKADITNLLFVGQEKDVRVAFISAGWVEAEPGSRNSVARSFHAFLGKQAYPKAPMNEFLLGERKADMNFQLSLNSYAMRHHVRIWRLEQTLGEQSLWLASATHDIGATLSFLKRRFYHRVLSDIDLEREKIVRDLSYVGSLHGLHYSPRPEMEMSVTNATGEVLVTDGNVAVLLIGSCTRCEAYPTHLQEPPVPIRPNNWFARYLRKQILTIRGDMLRSNIIYGAFDLSRRIRNKLRGED